MMNFVTILFLVLCKISVVSQEKAMEGISKFDKSQLKKTETSEKQSLPDQEGKNNLIPDFQYANPK